MKCLLPNKSPEGINFTLLVCLNREYRIVVQTALAGTQYLLVHH